MILVSRTEESETYKIANNKHRIVVGGDISNALSFDGDSNLYVPQRLIANEADTISSNVIRIRTARWGYTIHLDTGSIYIHPVRGHWNDKWYMISPASPASLSINQIGPKTIEFFVNTLQARYSFIVSDRGFKINIKLKSKYSGGSVFTQSFNVDMYGLKRVGRKIYDGNTFVGNLPNPFLLDSNAIMPVFRDVQESISGGQVTLTADVSGLTFPVNIDPSLTVQPSTIDSFMGSAGPATNFGTSATLNHSSINVAIQRAILNFDFSAMGAVNSIDAATLSLYKQFNFGTYTRAHGVYRLTQTNWTELGVTWNTYNGVNNWTSAGGDFTLTDGVTTNIVSTTNGWYDWNILALVQYAYTNTASVAYLLSKWVVDGDANNHQWRAYSKDEAVNVTLRPTLAIDYTALSSVYGNVILGDRIGAGGLNNIF